MINEYEAEVYIYSHLPGINQRYHTTDSNHLYENITNMADFMKKKFAQKDWKALSNIFNVAEVLYNKGNGMVKYGMQHVFIYAISSIMPSEKEQRKQLQTIIPITLFSVYVQQILHSNI